MITAQQLQKYTQSLFNQIYPTDTYEQLKALLYSWRDNNKTPTYAISTFLKIAELLSEHSPELLDDLNRCLLKDYSPDTSLASIAKVRQLALDNPYALSILDTIISWIRTEQPVQVNPPVIKAPQIE